MLAKYDLGCPVTPLQEAVHLSTRLGGPRIVLKRDDLTGLGLGGNKVRKLEYLFGDAEQKGANVVISSASIHSNFLRILAAASRKAGWRTRLLVRGAKDEPLAGNYLCYSLMGAEIEYIMPPDPLSPAILERMEEMAAEERGKGNVPYLIHLATYSAPYAILGYIDTVDEIVRQDPEPFDHIFVAVGSGGTYAGLKLGCSHWGLDTTVHGISVSLPADVVKEKVKTGMDGVRELLGWSTNSEPYAMDIEDRFIGPGYGIPTPESIEAVRLVAETEGILLDPIYTGKAFAALLDAVQTGTIHRNERVLFIHTGGTPNLFVHAASF